MRRGITPVIAVGNLDVVTANNGSPYTFSFFENQDISGSNGPCCESGDTFTNSTHSCCSRTYQAGSC